MSMNFYPMYGYYVPWEEVLKKLNVRECWENMSWDKDFCPVNSQELQEIIEGTEIETAMNRCGLYPEHNCDFIRIDGEADTAGSLLLENGKGYLAFNAKDLFYMTPKPIWSTLAAMDLEPTEDGACLFG